MSKSLDTVRLQNIAQGYAQSATLMAAVELGLFGVVERGAGTFDEVAVVLDLHPTSAERLMVMCAATGLLEKTDVAMSIGKWVADERSCRSTTPRISTKFSRLYPQSSTSSPTSFLPLSRELSRIL